MMSMEQEVEDKLVKLIAGSSPRLVGSRQHHPVIIAPVHLSSVTCPPVKYQPVYPPPPPATTGPPGFVKCLWCGMFNHRVERCLKLEKLLLSRLYKTGSLTGKIKAADHEYTCHYCGHKGHRLAQCLSLLAIFQAYLI